MGVQEERKNTF